MGMLPDIFSEAIELAGGGHADVLVSHKKENKEMKSIDRGPGIFTIDENAVVRKKSLELPIYLKSSPFSYRIKQGPGISPAASKEPEPSISAPHEEAEPKTTNINPPRPTPPSDMVTPQKPDYTKPKPHQDKPAKPYSGPSKIDNTKIEKPEPPKVKEPESPLKQEPPTASGKTTTTINDLPTTNAVNGGPQFPSVKVMKETFVKYGSTPEEAASLANSIYEQYNKLVDPNNPKDNQQALEKARQFYHTIARKLITDGILRDLPSEALLSWPTSVVDYLERVGREEDARFMQQMYMKKSLPNHLQKSPFSWKVKGETTPPASPAPSPKPATPSPSAAKKPKQSKPQESKPEAPNPKPKAPVKSPRTLDRIENEPPNEKSSKVTPPKVEESPLKEEATPPKAGNTSLPEQPKTQPKEESLQTRPHPTPENPEMAPDYKYPDEWGYTSDELPPKPSFKERTEALKKVQFNRPSHEDWKVAGPEYQQYQHNKTQIERLLEKQFPNVDWEEEEGKRFLKRILGEVYSNVGGVSLPFIRDDLEELAGANNREHEFNDDAWPPYEERVENEAQQALEKLVDKLLHLARIQGIQDSVPNGLGGPPLVDWLLDEGRELDADLIRKEYGYKNLPNHLVKSPFVWKGKDNPQTSQAIKPQQASSPKPAAPKQSNQTTSKPQQTPKPQKPHKQPKSPAQKEASRAENPEPKVEQPKPPKVEESPKPQTQNPQKQEGTRYYGPPKQNQDYAQVQQDRNVRQDDAAQVAQPQESSPGTRFLGPPRQQVQLQEAHQVQPDQAVVEHEQIQRQPIERAEQQEAEWETAQPEEQHQQGLANENVPADERAQMVEGEWEDENQEQQPIDQQAETQLPPEVSPDDVTRTPETGNNPISEATNGQAPVGTQEAEGEQIPDELPKDKKPLTAEQQAHREKQRQEFIQRKEQRKEQAADIFGKAVDMYKETFGWTDQQTQVFKDLSILEYDTMYRRAKGSTDDQGFFKDAVKAGQQRFDQALEKYKNDKDNMPKLLSQRVDSDRNKNLSSSKVKEEGPMTKGGINLSRKITLEDGSQGVFKYNVGDKDNIRPGFPGNYYKREAAASAVAEALGFDDLVPPTTVRESNGLIGSIQSFVPDAKGAYELGDNEKYDGPEDAMRAAMFDYLVGASDRHQGNWMLSKEGKLVLIDNGLTFPVEENRDAFSFASQVKATQLWQHNMEQTVPDMSHLKDKWPAIEKVLNQIGIESEAAQLVKARFDNLINNSGKPFGTLPFAGTRINNFAQ